MRIRTPLLALAVVGLVAGACGGNDDEDGADGSPRTIVVPDDQATIQDAVDDAAPGDLVLIEEGTYREQVTVTTPGIVIRGVDRNGVVLDGGHELTNGITVNADGVAVENLSIANYQFNGLLFVPDTSTAADGSNGNGTYGNGGYGNEAAVLQGYRASYITAWNNGLYGLYAFSARDGVFEDSYASGHPDSGIYIGQCDPCDAVVQRVVAEHNAVGFQGTNASTELYIVESTWRANRIGIQPNSDDAEREAPQHDAFVVGNVVADNDDPQTPGTESSNFGYGVALGGSQRTLLARNLVTGHANTGIAVLGQNDGFVAEDNRVEGNVLRDNEVDLEFIAPSGVNQGNCFTGNVFERSIPATIEALLGCADPATEVPAAATSQRVTPPPGVDHRTLPAPPAQPTMPDARTAPPRPVGMPAIDIARIAVPAS